jgi:hypothetical protein
MIDPTPNAAGACAIDHARGLAVNRVRDNLELPG